MTFTILIAVFRLAGILCLVAAMRRNIRFALIGVMSLIVLTAGAANDTYPLLPVRYAASSTGA
jgi:hypothetical protein